MSPSPEAESPLLAVQLEAGAVLAGSPPFSIAEHYEKGCFIGQEVIARIRTYGHLNRRLMAVRFRRALEAGRGQKLFRGVAEAGLVTSAAVSPRDGRSLALALGSPDGDEGEVLNLPPVGRA